MVYITQTFYFDFKEFDTTYQVKYNIGLICEILNSKEGEIYISMN